MIDLSYYETIGGANDEFLKDILLTIQVEIPLFVSDLKVAVAASDFISTKRLIHKFRPAWIAIGLPAEPLEIVSSDTAYNRLEALQNIEKITFIAMEEVKLKLMELDS